MIAGSDEAGGLARAVAGSAQTIAFGTSIVAPSASAATVLVYGFTAFAGFEAAAALGEEATDARRSVPVSIVGVVVVAGIFYLLVVCAEAFAAGRRSGSCTRWGANGRCPVRSAGCRTAGPRWPRSDASR